MLTEIPSLPEYMVDEVGNVWGKRKNDYLSVWNMPNGYQQVKINKKSYYVHRLVAEAFIPNPENKPCVNHKDNNRKNNCVENLEWCTHKENTQYAQKQNRMKLHPENLSMGILNNPITSKPIDQFTKNGIFIQTFPSIHEAARSCGGTPTLICGACHRENGSSHGYIWKYHKTSNDQR